MTDPKRVFCKDCKHYMGTVLMGRWSGAPLMLPYAMGNACGICITEFDPVKGAILVPSDALERNKNFDCADFTQKRTPEPSPKRPWWRFR